MTATGFEPTTAAPADTGIRPMVWLWPGQAMYLGPSFELGTHSTAVHTLAFGVDEEFTVATTAGSARRVRSVLIPARTRHRIEGTGRMLFFYLDPQSARCDGVRSAMRDRSTPLAAGHRAAEELFDYLHRPGIPEPTKVRRIVLGADAAPVPIDPRVRWTMERLLADPGRAPSATRAAEAARLSESRFLHLFAAEAGTSYRRYRLWARLLFVGAAVAAGRELTAAAADAGFASASHFSDTFRALFGLSATAVLAKGTAVIVLKH